MINLVTTGMMLLSILLLFAAIPKLIDSTSFRLTLKQLGMSSRLVQIISLLLPYIEGMTSVGLWFEETRLISLVFLFILTGAFIWAIMKGKRKKLRCNCFGSLLNEQFGWKTLVRVCIMIVLGVWVLLQGQIVPSITSILNEDILWSFMTAFNIFGMYVLINAVLIYRKQM